MGENLNKIFSTLFEIMKVRNDAAKETNPEEKEHELYAALVIGREPTSGRVSIRIVAGLPEVHPLRDIDPYVGIPLTIALQRLDKAMDDFISLNLTQREIRQLIYVDFEEGTLTEAFEKLVEERKKVDK